MAIVRNIELQSDIKEIGRLNKEIENMLDEELIFREQFFNINLVLEELFTNIVNHGYNNCNDHSISIKFEFEEEATYITIQDCATQFNPIEAPVPNLNIPAEERELGGLGIFLVKQLMDDVTYNYVDGKNVLILKKYKPQ